MRCGAEVLGAIQQPDVSGRVVAAGTTDLLVVRVERRRRLDMGDPPHIGLVDAHSERNGRGDDPNGALEERRHGFVPHARGETGVVERHALAGRLERVACGFRRCVRCGVDDAGSVELCGGGNERTVLVGLRADASRGKRNVRAVEVPDHDLGILQAEAPDDLLPHRLRRRRRQGNAHRCLQRIGLRTEPQIVGAEVMAPLADQMCLVDDEEPRPRTLQHVTRLRVTELLGREKDERIRPAGDRESGGMLARRLMRVEHDRRKPGGT